MAKMHSQLPLNFQEENVKEVLDENHLSYRAHEVFPIGIRSQVVDFFLPEQNVVIECWLSRSRRGAALTWIESKAAYIDLKFKRLKEQYPGIKCLGLVEVSQVDRPSLVQVVGAVMVHADWMTYSMMEFEEVMKNHGGAY